MVEKMRDRMERFVFLPFTMGCVSESSIGVGMPRYKRSKDSTPTRNPQEEKEELEYEDDYEECYSGDNLKSTLSIMALPKFQRLFKNFRNISSHIFEYKDEMDEAKVEMEIGLPTDVKHVTHIGLDGSTTSILSKCWDAQRTPTLCEMPSCPPDRFNLGMPTKEETLDVQGPCA